MHKYHDFDFIWKIHTHALTLSDSKYLRINLVPLYIIIWISETGPIPIKLKYNYFRYMIEMVN